MSSRSAVSSCLIKNDQLQSKTAAVTFLCLTDCLVHADTLLEPDDVTFSVLVRGYGESEPPQWLAISGLLSLMSRKYDVKPSTGRGFGASLLRLRACGLILHHALHVLMASSMLPRSDLQCIAGDLRQDQGRDTRI